MAKRLLVPLFWTLFGVFLLVFLFVLTPLSVLIPGPVRFLTLGTVPGAVVFLLGAAVLVFTVRANPDRKLRRRLLLTGASAVGFLVSLLLHDLVYALLALWFGPDFWDRTGIGDEPVFFTLAVVVCPIAFLTGSTLTIRRLLQLSKEAATSGHPPGGTHRGVSA